MQFDAPQRIVSCAKCAKICKLHSNHFSGRAKPTPIFVYHNVMIKGCAQIYITHEVKISPPILLFGFFGSQFVIWRLFLCEGGGWRRLPGEERRSQPIHSSTAIRFSIFTQCLFFIFFSSIDAQLDIFIVTRPLGNFC